VLRVLKFILIKEINMAKKPDPKIAALEYRIDQLERENRVLQAAASLRSRQEKEALDLLEQIHQVLDAVPNSISRESSERVRRTPLTRLAAWLAVRN
jgi:hypothetical protein